PEGAWIDAAIFMLILFVSVLLHEFGHCFAARSVGGDAQEVLLWPLGGLANVDVPARPLAHFLTAAAGPAVNIVLAVLAGLLLLVLGDPAFQPVWNPMPGGYPYRDGSGLVTLYTWSGEARALSPYALSVWLVRICWVNY